MSNMPICQYDPIVDTIDLLCTEFYGRSGKKVTIIVLKIKHFAWKKHHIQTNKHFWFFL